MPIPLSVTSNLSRASPAVSSSRYTCRVTSPCSVNLMAFPTRFVRTWRSRPGSPRNPVGTAAWMRPVNSNPLDSARSANCLSTSSTVERRLNSIDSSSSLPASILLHSRTSLINCRRASPHWRMISAYERCSGASAVSSNKLVIPITPFMGVRSSWLMVARNAALVCVAACAS